ncbi:MAG: hypothetical protein M0R77_00310 [Gammaproteobacteria bacterium]|nr:hypothetical protein [Gammaproteobacteria bacterium]
MLIKDAVKYLEVGRNYVKPKGDSFNNSTFYFLTEEGLNWCYAGSVGGIVKGKDLDKLLSNSFDIYAVYSERNDYSIIEEPDIKLNFVDLLK